MILAEISSITLILHLYIHIIEKLSILVYTYSMTGVNKTLFIPLYGKAKVSRQGIIIKDSMAEKIWDTEAFEVHGKSKSNSFLHNHNFQ